MNLTQFILILAFAVQFAYFIKSDEGEQDRFTGQVHIVNGHGYERVLHRHKRTTTAPSVTTTLKHIKHINNIYNIRKEEREHSYDSIKSREYEIKRTLRSDERKTFHDLLNATEQLFTSCPAYKHYKHHRSALLKNFVDKQQGPCIDPSPEEMDFNFYKLSYFFRELNGLFDISQVQATLKDFIVTDLPKFPEDVIIFGEKNCTIASKTSQSTAKELSICPWHYVIDVRHDKYPRTIAHARCTCDKCLHVYHNDTKKDSQYHCHPVYKLQPALKRDENCNIEKNNGIYDWIPVLEHVAVSCTCSRTLPVKIFKID